MRRTVVAAMWGALLIAMTASSPARAAVVTVVSVEIPDAGRSSGGSSAELLITDPDGRADDVFVDDLTVPGDRAVVFSASDPGGITPGPACTAISPTEVSCGVTPPSVATRTVRMGLGAGDDRAAIRGPGLTVILDGGSGDDVLTGPAGLLAFSAAGGAGNDTLTARGGAHRRPW